MNRITLSFLVIAFFSIFDLSAQQDAQFTHYMYNMNVVNPAYAGSRETLSIGILGRTQWVGFDGAPQTLTASIHAPVGKQTGLGLSLVGDQFGPVKEQNIYADFSYTIPTSDNTKLAFGLKGGISLFNVDSNLIVPDGNVQGDTSFKDMNKTHPNLGAGAYFYSDKFYLGLSVPNILKTQHFDGSKTGKATATDIMHTFFAAGVVFELSDNLKFKPSTMLKVAQNSPLSADFSANFLINEKFEIGANYRLSDSVSGMFLINALKDLRVGYAYDHTLSNLGKYNDGSHEVILLWDIQFSESNFKSPRFF
jgi:type IX secretion system PorP/SprF family membrane protein